MSLLNGFTIRILTQPMDSELVNNLHCYFSFSFLLELLHQQCRSIFWCISGAHYASSFLQYGHICHRCHGVSEAPSETIQTSCQERCYSKTNVEYHWSSLSLWPHLALWSTDIYEPSECLPDSVCTHQLIPRLHNIHILLCPEQ